MSLLKLQNTMKGRKKTPGHHLFRRRGSKNPEPVQDDAIPISSDTPCSEDNVSTENIANGAALLPDSEHLDVGQSSHTQREDQSYSGYHIDSALALTMPHAEAGKFYNVIVTC